MRLLDHLTGPQSQDAIKALAQTAGLSEQQAQQAISAIVPEFAKAIERNTLNRGGIADLVETMSRAARQPAGNPAQASEQGIDFLQTVLGSKDKSRSVAARVSRETGLDAQAIKDLLPGVAAMTAGALAQGARQPLQNVLSKFPGYQAASPLPMPGSLPDAFDPTDIPDVPARRTGGSSPGGIGRQSPLPIPGNNLPDIDYGNGRRESLPDVIRRGGTTVPGSGGSMGSVIRDILGGLLGFRNRGFMGWLFQAVLLPMLLRFGQSILRRVLTGR